MGVSCVTYVVIWKSANIMSTGKAICQKFILKMYLDVTYLSRISLWYFITGEEKNCFLRFKVLILKFRIFDLGCTSYCQVTLLYIKMKHFSNSIKWCFFFFLKIINFFMWYNGANCFILYVVKRHTLNISVWILSILCARQSVSMCLSFWKKQTSCALRREEENRQ